MQHIFYLNKREVASMYWRHTIILTLVLLIGAAIYFYFITSWPEDSKSLWSGVFACLGFVHIPIFFCQREISRLVKNYSLIITEESVTMNSHTLKTQVMKKADISRITVNTKGGCKNL